MPNPQGNNQFASEAYAEVYKGEVRGQERIKIKAPFKYKDTLKSLPGSFFDPRDKSWHVIWSAALVPSVEAALTGLHIRSDEAYEGLRRAYVALDGAQAAKTATDLPPLPTKTTGWLHQLRSYAFIKDLKGGALFLDMGGGKSLAAIAKLEATQPALTVILCPKSVMGVWPKQFKQHARTDWEVWSAGGAGTTAKKAEKFRDWFLGRRRMGRKCVLIVNYDAAWRPAFEATILWAISEAGGCALVLDESHKIKAPGGRASKFTAKLGARATWVLLLTGTPMPHGPEDIYAQYRAADPGIFGTSFSRFKNKYFITRPIPGTNAEMIVKLNPEMEQEFHRKLGSISFVVKRDEMGLDVPQRLPSIDRYADLSAKTMRHYKQLEAEFLTELDNGEYAVADNALTKLMRLRQLCSGFIKDIDGTEHQIGTEKQELFADVLDDLPRGEPVVVFAAFHHDLDTICDVATNQGLRYGELSGRRRDGLSVDSTLADGFDVVGVQLQSGGVGVDFTRSRYGVYYSIDYNLGNIEQSFARLDRPGQKYPVRFIHLLTKFPTGHMTVDGITYKAIEERRDLVEATLEASRRQ